MLFRSYIVKDDGAYDHIGLEELASYGCDILPKVIEFLQGCPRVIAEDQEYIRQVRPYIPQPDYLPIQHPANLNIIKEYPRIFVDIVCETRVTGNVFFVTEKTWRCILAQRPFIIVGSQYFLQRLRRLGFRTFIDFWDEGYDEYEPGQRIREIERLLAQISAWSADTLAQKLQDMQPILAHNLEVFQSLTYDRIRNTFDD